jgi:uncharacterized membrane protein YgcG
MKTIKFTGMSSLSLLLVLAGLLFFAPQARADDEEKDPPTRVARISFTEGSVSLQPGGEGDWGTAAKNRPMTIGDKIWVDKDSRAELQTGAAAIHLGSMTALAFLNLDGNITQMRLPEGSLNFRVRELREGDVYEVDTPNVAFTVRQAGAFRIDVSENGDSSRIIVIRGEGEVAADGKTYPVHAGEQAEFNGEQNPTYSISKAPGPDGLDRWAEERDLREDRSVSEKYVSPDMPGADDLDDSGSWRQEPDYGNVWYPNDVGPDWAPYSDGYWSSVGPWGWTWVGNEPWGFAPYHYGRWSWIGGRWGWCPGPFYGAPVYGPAFVGFLGGGFGFGLGFGVGWFPLGWGEPFFPWYHCGPRYINVINVHNTFIRNVNVFNNRNFNYVNAHNVRAVTTTSRNGFMNGERVNRGAQHITQASLNNLKATNSVGLKPTAHSSLGAANVNAHAARPSSAIQNRSVIARTAPAAGVQAHNNVRVAGPFTHNGANATTGANGRIANSPNNSGVNSRQHELSQNRPPSATNNGSARPGNSNRVWEAQGNTSDRGHAPQGFGSDRPANNPAQNSPRVSSDRPPWAHNGAQPGSTGPNNNRSYEPQRNYSEPSYGNRGSSPRTYTPPSRSYPSPSRSYSPPARSYSPPPSHSSGGGAPHSSGGGSHSSGGGSHSSGGGGGSHGGGGRPHR